MKDQKVRGLLESNSKRERKQATQIVMVDGNRQMAETQNNQVPILNMNAVSKYQDRQKLIKEIIALDK